jgi:DNA-binding NarL/FixJ family response regulator
MTRVVLAESEQIFRYGTKLILEREGFDVVAEVTNGVDALDAVKRLMPDILIIGASIPERTALDVARELSAIRSRTRTILLVEGHTTPTIAEMVAAGVLGCIYRSHDISVLISAMQDILNGAAVYWCVDSGAEGTSTKGSVHLSPREREVLQLLAGGLSKRVIAEKLGMSIRTVEAHRASVMAKLKIDNTAGLVRFAMRTGLIEP